ncbi:hypothetical protein GGD81_002488 [Rhodobium orientis]|uniref:Uncharacterized protein n=1 Tax=Rhodobium orientis TaxID=34017 RepID=A0A327JI62_9HYPH|nr:hypothetical protein [Rhodobium orientis]MBB4303445.1 hypothetical protein [Rhodobium orientis]MBK5950379.1 hypothetical protein [Rhodobium orientis]RAI25014.1 hypothetical protein CH339_19945 [Rhodobium orientis]
MPLKKLADDAVSRIEQAVSAPLGDAERAAVSRIVEQAMIDAVAETTQHCTDAARLHIGADEDKAHKFAEKVRRAEAALVSNLTGLR